MQLVKQVPARRRTLTFKWVKRDFMEYGVYRDARKKMRLKDDGSSCYWCKHPFGDGEMMALAQAEEVQKNVLLCRTCLDTAEGDDVRTI